MRVGIDIGGTTITVAIIDKYNIIRKKTIKTCVSDGSDKVIDGINNTIQKTIDESGYTLANISHIGIGCPGMIDRTNGKIIYSNNFQWENISLVEKIQRVFSLPIFLENDANCAALGEYIAGAGKNYKSMVLITFGTGIGGGFIIDDKIYRGFNGFSSLVGHLIISTGGKLCTCGRRGCWEAYSSVSALIKDAEILADNNPGSILSDLRIRDGELNGKNIFEAIHLNDLVATELFEKFINYMAEGIIDLINILNPQSIIIGGGISEQGEIILKPLRELVLNSIYCGEATMPVINAAALGNDAGVIGAAYLDNIYNIDYSY